MTVQRLVSIHGAVTGQQRLVVLINSSLEVLTTLRHPPLVAVEAEHHRGGGRGPALLDDGLVVLLPGIK